MVWRRYGWVRKEIFLRWDRGNGRVAQYSKYRPKVVQYYSKVAVLYGNMVLHVHILIIRMFNRNNGKAFF